MGHFVSACRKGKDCAVLTCALHQIKNTGLFIVLSVHCSTCYYGGHYGKTARSRSWPVFSWFRKTTFFFFFLMPNFTSGIMMEDCILFAFLKSINIWLQLATGFWLLTFLTYCSLSVQRILSYSQVGLPPFFAQQSIKMAIFRDGEISSTT